MWWIYFLRWSGKRPKCYLLDEPTEGLDEERTALLLKYLRENAKTYLISSHDREFLRAATDRVYELKAGKVARITP